MEVSSINILNWNYVLTFGKWAILLILIIYAIFAFVIVRQVDLMGKTLITGISKYLRFLSLIHAVFAVCLIILTYIIL